MRWLDGKIARRLDGETAKQPTSSRATAFQGTLLIIVTFLGRKIVEECGWEDCGREWWAGSRYSVAGGDCGQWAVSGGLKIVLRVRCYGEQVGIQ